MFKRMLQKIKSFFTTEKNERELPDVVSGDRRIKLGIVVGHTAKAPGADLARPFNQSEYEYHSEVAQIAEHLASKKNYPIDVAIFYRDLGGIYGAYSDADKARCDCVVELHFNAYDKKAAGTITLCSSSQRDIEFASIFQRRMCHLFKRDGFSRGVRSISRADRGGTSVHSFPNGPNCLVEPVFGDNPTEAEMYVTLKTEYAELLLQAAQEWGLLYKLI